MTTIAIVVAAGAGTRMGVEMPKAFIPLRGRPLMAWSILQLERSPRVHGIVLVSPPGMERPTEMALGALAETVTVTKGGATRSRSVAAGLAQIQDVADVVLVHDAARPLVTEDHVSMVLDGIGDADGAIIAAPVADTIKRTNDDFEIVETVDRSVHWLAQTPQAFKVEALSRAIEAAEAGGYIDQTTDCAAMLEAAGGRVRVVPSVLPNHKVTLPNDLELVDAVLAAREP